MPPPSFSSFPPSFGSFPDLEPQAGPSRSPSGLPSRSTRERTDSRKQDKSRKERREKSKNLKDSSHREGSARYSQESCPVLDDEQLKAAQDRERRTDENGVLYDTRPLFYSDRKGDFLNVRYGGLHAGDIPRYRLVGGGRKILGLNHAWAVLHRSGKGIEIGVGSRRKQASLTDSSSRTLLAAAPTRHLVASDSKYKYEEIDGFLRLPSRRGRQNDQSYRSITLSKTNAHSDSDSSGSDPETSGSSDDDSDTTLLTSQQAALKALEQELASNPSSISTWLSLLAQSLSNIPVTSKNATKSRSEITLAILARALSADPLNGTSQNLRLKYMKAGDDVWHESKLRAEWEDALKIGGTEIWMEWLEWRIRKPSNGLDGIVKDAKRALDALGGDEEGEIGQIRIIWRVAAAFQAAGFVERATALFQAEAELTFEVPQAMYGLPLGTQLDGLEEFWEAEVPRCGESGAKGWAAWVSSGRPDHIPGASPSDTVRTSEEMTTADPLGQWAASESRLDHVMRVPTRSTDEVDDPYAMVLFSDIRPLLVCLTSSRVKDAFRLAWLTLLGLHIPGFSASLSPESEDDRWSYTHLASPACLASIFPPEVGQRHIAAEAYAGVIIGREREYASGFGPVKESGYGVVGPLESIGKRMWGKEDVQEVDEGFVRKVFEQLRMGAEDWEWDTYALAFEAALNVKSALKLSRSFLSTARDSLLHWNAHARLERLRGRIDDARKVYETVLASSPPPDRPGVSSLWWDWAEMEWLAGNSDAAVRVISRSVGVEGGGGVMLLRTKRGLDDALRSVSIFRWKDREAWLRLRALLELMTSSPAAALSALDSHLAADDTLKRGSVAHESFTVASVSLLYHHGTTLRNPLPPAMLRERLEKAVAVYPSNTLLIGMFLEGEKGQGVWGRVRGLLGAGIEKDIARRVAEVWIAGWEKGRWEGEIERTRSGLANAVNSERTRGSHVIWRVYLEFEIRAGQLQRAKSMLYRAIGENPLCKELYLVAFGRLRKVFNGKELSDFADTMAERGIRMRSEVERDIEEEKSEDEEGMNETENEASEYRRLLPY